MTEKYKQISDELKKEYFGIDQQIDEIVNTFEMWETTKDYLVRPQILNLVGPSGLGKTVVINEIIKKLNLIDKKIYFKFNNKTTDVTKELKLCNNSDTVFVMDEIQYLKSINEAGNEIREEDHRGFNILWDLLDGGIISLQKTDETYVRVYYLLYILDNLNKFGVTYSKGVFYHKNLFKILEVLKQNQEPIKSVERFKKHIECGIYDVNKKSSFIDLNFEIEVDHDEYDSDDEKTEQNIMIKNGEEVIDENDTYYSKTEQTLDFLLPDRLEDLTRWLDGRTNIKFKTEQELKSFLINIPSIQELFNFFNECNKITPKPIIKDFHNSLIITISNLDEAYNGITKQVGADGDLDADWYNKESKKISILQIRKALLKRFRAEQIARFGSKWVIYPMLGKKSFQLIIEKELNMFETTIKTKFDIVEKVKFGEKIKNLIYAEGVFSPLGARCVFSTVSEIILEKFSNIIQTLITFEGNKNIIINIDFNKQKNLIEISYKNSKGNILKTDNFKYKIKIDSLRCEKKQNIGKQVHRGVHEAGHAVCSIVLRKVFPEVIYSTLIESGDAFNMFNEDDFYMNRINNYMNDVAVLMGGYAAEYIIFGEENLSSGSSSDLSKVTQQLSTLFKECGFGDKLGKFVSEQMPDNTPFRDGNYCLTDNENKLEVQIKQKIKEGLELAIKTINEQKILLLKITEYLIKQPKMNNKKIKEYSKKYLVNFDLKSLEENKTDFYLNIINKELEKLK